jgi:hypothetical protein
MQMTPAEAHSALQRLISSRKIREKQVRAALKEAREIAALRARIASLEGTGGRAGRRPGRPAGGARRGAPKRRRVSISPKVRALRRLQGKYMGYVRRLKPAEKARVRAVREKEGMAAAIRLATSLAKSS